MNQPKVWKFESLTLPNSFGTSPKSKVKNYCFPLLRAVATCAHGKKKTCWTMLCAFPISPAFFFSISLDMICGTHFYRIESQSKLNHLPSETKRNVVAEKNLQMSSQIFLLVILGRNHRSSIGKKAWHPQKNCLQRLPKRKATFPFS